MRPKTAILLILMLCLLIYGAGLRGPFLFDDLPNFSAISKWLGGRGRLAMHLGCLSLRTAQCPY